MLIVIQRVIVPVSQIFVVNVITEKLSIVLKRWAKGLTASKEEIRGEFKR